MDLQLKAKTALVTGSTAGIGFAISRALAREGASVVITGRTQERVDEAIENVRRETRDVKISGIAADLGTGRLVMNFERLPAWEKRRLRRDVARKSRRTLGPAAEDELDSEPPDHQPSPQRDLNGWRCPGGRTARGGSVRRPVRSSDFGRDQRGPNAGRHRDRGAHLLGQHRHGGAIYGHRERLPSRLSDLCDPSPFHGLLSASLRARGRGLGSAFTGVGFRGPAPSIRATVAAMIFRSKARLPARRM